VRAARAEGRRWWRWRPVSVEVAAGKEGSVVQPEALEVAVSQEARQQVAVSQEARQQVAEALEVALAEEGVLQVPLSGGCTRPLAQPGIPQELDHVCDKKY